MKLIYRILLRLSLALLAVLTVWTVFFYFTMIDEINDEVDDALEDYSETIIIRSLAGKELPSKNDGSNNSYSIRPITREEARQYPAIEYYDADIYIKEKEETEPARVLRTIFADKDDNYFLLLKKKIYVRPSPTGFSFFILFYWSPCLRSAFGCSIGACARCTRY